LLYRGGIGATLGAIGAQLPYPYVHLVYWTVQLLLAITAIQYGCDIGVEWYSKANGALLAVSVTCLVILRNCQFSNSHACVAILRAGLAASTLCNSFWFECVHPTYRYFQPSGALYVMHSPG
jgi:hypothetical protein